jgi:hypothetical protein
MNRYFFLFCFFICGCSKADSNDARFKALADRATRGDMSALVQLQKEFPDRLKKLHEEGDKERMQLDAVNKAEKSKLRSIKDLFGYDLSLDYKEFNEKYKNKIDSCKEENRYRGKDSFPFYNCYTKDQEQLDFGGLDGKHLIRSFYKSFKNEEILASTFHQKLMEKTGLKREFSKYDTDLNIPFFQGTIHVNYFEKQVGKEYIHFVNDLFYTSDESMDVLFDLWTKKQIEQLSNKTQQLKI